MARTRLSTGNTSHAPEIFKNHNVPKKYGGSKGQPPAKAPGQGKHHGGGYTPGATTGNLVTKGNLNIPSFMYKPYNKKPYLGKHHLYSYVPPVSHIANPAKRTHMPAPGTVSSIANPATRTHMAAPGPTAEQQVLAYRQGKNVLGPHPLPPGVVGVVLGVVATAAAAPILIGFRALSVIVRGAFALGGTQPKPTGENVPGQGESFYGADWQPSSYFGVQPGENPYWQVPPGGPDIFP